VFGCIAFVLIPGKNSKKLDYKFKECTFLRYSEENKDYKLMKKSNRFVFISRDNIFQEETKITIIIVKEKAKMISLKKKRFSWNHHSSNNLLQWDLFIKGELVNL